jgi:hypothetical protein
MPEILTFQQMKRRYAGEWLLVRRAETDDELNLLAGEVLAHSADRDEVYRKLLSEKPRGCVAIEFGGPPPEDLSVML